MSTNHTQTFFENYASDFDSIYGGRSNQLINKLFRKAMKLRFLKTLEACDPVREYSVLDVGCGPGHYCVALARNGATRVVGLDFAPGMIQIASKHAEEAGVANQCRFEISDFMAYEAEEPFDYTIVMGFMDYIGDSRPVIQRIVSLTRRKALFSFPAAGGFLAWQRKLRYRSRCDLFFYSRAQLENLFSNCNGATVKIEQIDRDFFVTVSLHDS